MRKYISLLGVVLSQCADIGLAHLSYSQSREDESYYADDLNSESNSTQIKPTYYYIILVRWLKGKVYVVSLTSESREHNLDPQPNHTCHMTKWSRMDPLDPNTISLSDVFHYNQVSDTTQINFSICDAAHVDYCVVI